MKHFAKINKKTLTVKKSKKMRTSFIGRSLIKTFEGYRGVAYR